MSGSQNGAENIPAYQAMDIERLEDCLADHRKTSLVLKVSGGLLLLGGGVLLTTEIGGIAHGGINSDRMAGVILSNFLLGVAGYAFSESSQEGRMMAVYEAEILVRQRPAVSPTDIPTIG